MTYSEAKKRAVDILKDAGIEEADVDAEYLLEEALGLDRSTVFMRLNEELPSGAETKFFSLIGRRESHEPLQYIIGNQDFMGYTFIVTPDVLIPRFDTEILAELATKRAEQVYKRETEGSDTCLKILDLCTGSGCVAISVGLGLYDRLSGRTCACLERGIEVVGADISASALKVAEKNLELNLNNARNNRFPGRNIKVRISFKESDLFKDIKDKYHIITANPPYIVRDEIKTLMPEITEHEPYLALDGGNDGMDFYRRIAKEAPDYLYAGGRLLMELDDLEAEPVGEMLKAAGFKEIEIHRDLAGFRRVIEGVI